MSLCGMPYEEADVYADFWNEKVVKGRKEYRCEECGGQIARGEHHGFATGLQEGEWFTVRRCRACLFLAEMVAMETGTCALWGGLDDYISFENDERAHRGAEPFPTPREHRKQWDERR